MDTELALKATAAIASVIASAKIALEISRSRKPRIREDYQFAKEFFSHYSSETPDLMVELGYAAITGDASLDADEIRHFFSRQASMRLLAMYSSGKRFLEFMPKDGPRSSLIRFKEKYGSISSRRRHQRWHMANYFVFSMLAILSVFYSRRIFQGDVGTWLLVSFATSLGFGSISWDCIKSYVRMARAEHVVAREQEVWQFSQAEAASRLGLIQLLGIREIEYVTWVLWGYPLDLMGCGPVQFSTFEADINETSGAHLDYAYSLASQTFETVAIEFLPSGHPERIRVSSKDGLIPFQRDCGEDQMRRFVEARLGSRVQLLRVVTA